MARYTGPKVRLTRRLKFLPGLTSKKLDKNSKVIKRPGQHGIVRKKPKPYAVRLEEKQKLRFNYGLNERQLINYIKKAKRIKGATGNILLQLIEMRLDNIVFRLGMASSIPTARQLIGHKHILLNFSCVSIPKFYLIKGNPGHLYTNCHMQGVNTLMEYSGQKIKTYRNPPET